jgi:hypothetical protein
MEEVKARYYRNQYPEMLSFAAERCTTNTFDWKDVLHVPVGLSFKKISPVTGLEWPRSFQEVKVPRFLDNRTVRW